MALDTAATASAPKDAVGSLCSQIPHLPAGSRAALRRLFLTRSNRAIGIVTGLLLGTGVPEWQWRDPLSFARWELLAHIAAILSGTAAVSPHRPGPQSSLGRALHEAGYSELRLMRLTSARGPALTDQIVRAARALAAAGQLPVDLRTLHALSHREDAKAEQARLDIARGFFAAKHASTRIDAS